MIHVFGLKEKDAILKACRGEKIGTVVYQEDIMGAQEVYKEKMEKTLSVLKQDLNTVRAGQ